MKKNSKKINQEEFTMEKLTKKKGDKLYVKWNGNNNSSNCWIDEKDVI